MTTNSFLEKLRIEGSKIQQMTRLPVTHNLVVKNLSKKAWWSVGTAALATGLAIEEVVSGQVAKSLEGVTGIRDKIRKRTQARQRQQGYNYRGSDPE